jgi:predicted DNA binding CopG/RHH family protein
MTQNGCMESKKAINLRMRTDLIDEMKQVCKELDVSYAHFIRTAVKEKIAEIRQREEAK